jgi:phosphonate transport system substrate-binding protein
MKLFIRIFAVLFAALMAASSFAAEPPLKFGVGLFQPDKEKNDATYRPLADYLAKKLGRTVELRTVDSWEGLAKSLSTGETDIALLGPWGYVLANSQANAQVISTILYDGKPEYFAIMVTSPDSGINSPKDLKGKTFAFGDKGSTSGYLIPLHYFMQQGIDPENRDAGHTGRAGCRSRLQPQPQCHDRARTHQGREVKNHLGVGTAAQ